MDGVFGEEVSQKKGYIYWERVDGVDTRGRQEARLDNESKTAFLKKGARATKQTTWQAQKTEES